MNIDTVLIENEPLIHYIANKFYNVDKEDLYQAGRMGLIKAFNRYDESRSTKFSTFAYMSIFGEMHDLMQSGNLVNLNRQYLNVGKKIDALSNNFFLNVGRYPSIDELSAELGYETTFISEVIIMSHSLKSLDEEREQLELYETIPAGERDLTSEILLKDAIERLPSPEKEIMALRLYGDLSQTEIAKKLGMTQVRVSRCEKNAKKQMKEYASAA